MKRKGPTLGHSQADYRLCNIFKRAAKEFQEADVAREKIDEERKNKAEPESIDVPPRRFSLQERRMEAGVVLLMTTGAFLEQVINDYAHTFLDSDSYEEHLDNLRSVSKWIVLPRLSQNKEI